MKVKDLFHRNTSFFHESFQSKNEILEFLSNELHYAKIITNQDQFLAALKKREKEGPTGMGDGVAIPHALTPTVKKSTIAFLSLEKPVKWGSLDDKPVDLIFAIATNGTDGDEHLKALADLSGYLIDGNFVKKLRKVDNYNQLQTAFGDYAKAKKAHKTEVVETKTQIKNKSGGYDVVGITACPTGIAHTYLAQDKLIEGAKKLGLTVKIETQGRRGVENRLTESDIANAKVVILAHDKALEGMNRFNGVRVIDTTTKEAIFHSETLIKNFHKHPKAKTIKGYSKSDDETGELSLKKFKDFKGNLLGGVSRMLPFVVGGGIVLGIGFLIDFIAGNGNAGGSFGAVNKAAGWFSAIGKTGMMMMVPVLGGYIAYSIVGAQGLMPGFIAGLFADGTGGFAYNKNIDVAGFQGLWTRLLPEQLRQTTNSGFLGAMVGGYMAALMVYGLTLGFRKFTRPFQGIRDIVLIPVLSILGISLFMFAINIPLGYALWGIKTGLTWMAEHNLLIPLGAILGLMVCFDMGGPINKIAYILGVLSVGGELGDNPLITNIMASVMAAGMVPPLGIALCTVIFRRAWDARERDAAKTNWLMGAFFITEGAIPFMITDPKRVSISGMSGGVITGLLVGLFKITLPAPHGGIFVFPLLDSHLWDKPGLMKGMGIVLYIAAIAIGMLIMALILGFWRSSDIRSKKLRVDSGLSPSGTKFFFKNWSKKRGTHHKKTKHSKHHKRAYKLSFCLH